MRYPALALLLHLVSTILLLHDTLLWAESCPSCRADFAIYAPSEEIRPSGVWSEEVQSLEKIIRVSNRSSLRISDQEINRGALGEGNSRKFRVLIAPGGRADYRALAVNETGNDYIRKFVHSGGGFIGFCAGAYWAANRVGVATEATLVKGKYIATRDYQSYDYPLKLFPGDAIGPFGWMPWRSGTNFNFDQVEINHEIPRLKSAGLPRTARLLYGGGPFFSQFSSSLSGLEIWAYATAPQGTPSQVRGDKEPSIIKFDSGAGTVILFAYHPDIQVNAEALFAGYRVSWNTEGTSVNEINEQSITLVQAAFEAGIKK